MLSSLKPLNFDEYVGQAKLVSTLKVVIESARLRRKQVDHILLYGAPGLGKTSLANVISNKMEAHVRYAQGPMLERKSDILSLFGSVGKGDVIFIDEIHGINKNVEELLYSALEDGFLDVVVGVEGDAKIMRMNLPPFTLIGATTKIGRISSPLRDRFGIVGKIAPYSPMEIKKIITHSARALKIKIDDDAKTVIATFSRRTPRVANNLLKRAHDFQVVSHEKRMTKEIAMDAFQRIGLYKFGLSEHHVSYLRVLSETFDLAWSSVDAIAGSLREEKETIEMEIEPILMELKLIRKSSRGRQITPKGVEYLASYTHVA